MSTRNDNNTARDRQEDAATDRRNDLSFREMIEKLSAHVESLDDNLITFIAEKKSCEELCKAHNKSLNGNGYLGLKSRVAILTWALGVQVALLVAIVGVVIEQAFRR